MRSRIFSFDMVRASSKKQLWIPGFLALGFFLVFPVAQLMMLDKWGTMNYTDHQLRILYENLWRDGFLISGFVMGTFAALINGIHGFIYLHSSQKVDFYHSLPVKRSEMFWHRTWVGLLYTGIPYGIMVFLSGCIGWIRGFFSAKILGLAVKMTAMHLLLYLLIYFTVVLAMALTGKSLSGLLLMAVLFFYAPVLGGLISQYRSLFYSTDYTMGTYGLTKVLLTRVSPLALGIELIAEHGNEGWLRLLSYVLLAVLILGGTAFCIYRRRPSESAGTPIISAALAKLIKIMVTVPCGLGFGIIFYSLSAASASKVFWWGFGMILGTVLTHGSFEILYQGEFRKFFSKKLELAAAGILVLFFAAWYQLGLGGFDTYIPERDQLKAINVRLDGLNYGNDLLVEKMEDGTYHVSHYWDDGRNSLFSGDSQLSEELYRFFADIVSDQDIWQDPETTESLMVAPLHVKYTLSSGRAVYRSYHITSAQARDLMLLAFREGQLKERKYSFLSLDDECMAENVNGEFVSGDFTLLKNQPEKYRELLEALRMDVEKAGAEELLEQPVARLVLNFRIPKEEDVFSLVPGEEGVPATQILVDVLPAFEKTLAFIEKLGYGDKVWNGAVKSLELHYEEDDSEKTKQETEVKRMDDPEELLALKDCLVPGCFMYSMVDYELEPQIWANCIMEDGTEVYCYLRKDRIPEFLAEWIREMQNTLNSGEDAEYGVTGGSDSGDTGSVFQ